MTGRHKKFKFIYSGDKLKRIRQYKNSTKSLKNIKFTIDVSGHLTKHTIAPHGEIVDSLPLSDLNYREFKYDANGIILSIISHDGLIGDDLSGYSSEIDYARNKDKLISTIIKKDFSGDDVYKETFTYNKINIPLKHVEENLLSEDKIVFDYDYSYFFDPNNKFTNPALNTTKGEE